LTAHRLVTCCATPAGAKAGGREAATAPATPGEAPAGTSRRDDALRSRFEALVLPHLDAAFNLARWLLRNDDDASDVVQDAYLRAMRSFAGFRGEQARPWVLAIVRNTAYSWMASNRNSRLVSYEPDLHDEAGPPGAGENPTPEFELSRAQDRRAIDAALARLPVEMREALILRELEDLPYREIAAIQAIPIGTVMSRLSRGRQLLRKHLRQAMPGVDDELH
jgi:RNA polymerase sigma-70 factor, ECF subfamily